MGVKRKYLCEWSRDLLCGSKLINMDGLGFEYINLWKFKDLSTIISVPERVKLILNPEYVVAVASDNEYKIDELMHRIRSLDFEYDVFGGNDYHFVKDIGELKEAKVYPSNIGEGYVPAGNFSTIETMNKKASIYTAYVRGKVRDNFIFALNGLIKTKEKQLIVDNGKDKIFVYEPEKFLSL